MVASLPPPNVALLDTTTGLIAKPWYQYFFESSTTITTGTGTAGLWTYMPTGSVPLGLLQPLLESPVGILIDTPAGNNRAINVVQSSGPTDTTTAVPFFYNYINILNSGLNVASGNGSTYGFGVNLTASGAANGQQIGLLGRVLLLSPLTGPFINANYAGVVGICRMAANAGGTNTGNGSNGYIIGGNLIGTADGGATNIQTVTATELLSGMWAGSSARYHVTARVLTWGNHVVDAAELSAGIQIGGQSGSIGWRDYGIVFDSFSAGFGTYLSTTGTLIGTKGAQTFTNGIDLRSASITGFSFAGFNFTVSGGGGLRANRLGYFTGTGGTVTQTTNKATAVTLNQDSGHIITSAGSLAANTTVKFTFNNAQYSAVAGDVIICHHAAGGTAGGAYRIDVGLAGASAVTISITNVTINPLAEALTLNFCVIRGAL